MIGPTHFHLQKRSIGIGSDQNKKRIPNMYIMRILSTSIAILLSAAFANAQDASTPVSAPEQAAKTIRMLFIGNSLTSRNDLPAMLEALCKHSTPSIALETVRATVPGCTLEKHWAEGKALAAIKEGKWDYVVIQDASAAPIANYESMARNARLFDAEIKKVNAKTLFYMTWELRGHPEDLPKIKSAYLKIGEELGNDVVPVGVARANAMKEDGSLDLYVKDGKHPTPTGTYLAACTFYAYLSGQLPRNAPCKIMSPADPEKTLVDLTPEKAEFLQKVAAETVLGKKAITDRRANAGQ